MAQPIVIAMELKGRAQPGAASGFMQAQSKASQCMMLQGQLAAAKKGEVQFSSNVAMTGQHSFVESGTLSFGDGKTSLSFQTIGRGYMAPNPDKLLSAGAITWRIAGGTGELTGASGYITSNFCVTPQGELTDYDVAVIYPRAAKGARKQR
ncbi:MAG: hypothetical protein FJX56_14570 [Alphaproteobacteria bacterium]|nr:hypothetical protein [Alphaproteobacteria bacterium]